MREWQIVTVAWRWSRSSAAGLPTMSLRPITTAFAPCSSTSYSSSSASTPSGVPGTCAGVPASSRPAFSGGMPSTSLTGSIGADHTALVDPVRQRQLDEDPVDGVVGVQLGDEREQLLLARRRRQAQIARLDPDLERRLVLQPDVDVRGGIVADEHRREADRAPKAATSAATSSRIRAASAFPSMRVAAILRTRINKLSGMELRKWPRRNDAESISARREAIRGVVGDEPLAHDDEAWTAHRSRTPAPP